MPGRRQHGAVGVRGRAPPGTGPDGAAKLRDREEGRQGGVRVDLVQDQRPRQGQPTRRQGLVHAGAAGGRHRELVPDLERASEEAQVQQRRDHFV